MTMDEMKRQYRAKQEQIRKLAAVRTETIRRGDPIPRRVENDLAEALISAEELRMWGESGADPSTSGGEIASSFLIVRSHVVPRSGMPRTGASGDHMSTFITPKLRIVLGVQGAISVFIRFTRHIDVTDRGHREPGGEPNGAQLEMLIHCSNHFQQLQRRSISTYDV
jgi:hypothetical protein